MCISEINNRKRNKPDYWNPLNLCFSIGYLGPGGLHDDAKYPGKCIGGATGYVDRKVLTVSHIYQNPTAKGVYDTEPFDPEGILGKMIL